jgi:hypothetical protein
LELVVLPNSDRRVLSLLHLKTIELDENVQCAKVSPDNKLLAVALLDNTIKIFFKDTFKVWYNCMYFLFTVICILKLPEKLIVKRINNSKIHHINKIMETIASSIKKK